MKTSPPGLKQLESEMASLADPVRARILQGFFKTGAGHYGEGDRFLGITVPKSRQVAARFLHLDLSGIRKLLASPLHEHRFVALVILVKQYQTAPDREKPGFVAFYLSQANRINNWDLVDTSAPYILGHHFRTHPRTPLKNLARSTDLWERRIAIVSTLGLIKVGMLDDTFRIAEMLLEDRHDLIHKAVGWALREAGKVSPDRLLSFLEQHYAKLPRTALRYAIERFPLDHRKRLLTGNFAGV